MDGKTLVTRDLHDPSISLLIARELAKLHSARIPAPDSSSSGPNKNPENRKQPKSPLKSPRHANDDFHQVDPKVFDPDVPQLFPRVRKWLENAKKVRFNEENGDKEKNKAILLRELDLEAIERELSWFETRLHDVRSPVVFCHNDLQEGNLILETKNKCEHPQFPAEIPYHQLLGEFERRQLDANYHLYMIDFEYASYNYRGFDLGNHICEHFIDYTIEKWPHYVMDQQMMPSEQHVKRFLHAYLDHCKRFQLDKLDEMQPVSQQEIDSLYEETLWFCLASHYQWIVWSVVMSTSDIEFGYLEYANERWQHYQKFKQHLLAKFPQQ